MSDTKTNALPTQTVITLDDLLIEVNAPPGTPLTDSIKFQYVLAATHATNLYLFNNVY